MELKKSGMKEKLVSAKQRASRLFRLARILRSQDSDASSPNPIFTEAPLTQTEASLYWHELRKAEALLHWQKWMNRER